MKTIAAVHTAMPMVEPTQKLIAEYYPEAKLITIVDDSLIQEVIANEGVTDSVKNRLSLYYQGAIEAGADVIFNTCSSVGDVALEARKKLTTPLVKIDDAMAKKAVENYEKIGVLATLSSTLEPTIRLLNHFADELHKSITTVPGLAEGAFQAVISGDTEGHDERIRLTATKIASEVDCLVLAQGSMARMEMELKTITGKPVLSSPELGTQSLKEFL